MKITYVYLKNFIGIKTGRLNKTEFELSFDNSLKTVLLLGNNGSGKSTLMSALTPFAESIDNRPYPVFQDKDGMKIIIFTDGEKRYYAEHHYLKGKTKSFLYLIDEEDNVIEDLNEGGRVTVYKQLMEELFGLTLNNMKLMKIGSDTASFLSLPTAERKKMFSTLLPSIDEYLKLFKTTREKFVIYQRELKTLSDQISKLTTVDQLLAEKQILVDSKNAIKSNLDAKSKEIAKLRVQLDILNTFFKDNEYLTKAEEFKKIENELKLLNLKIESIESGNDITEKDLKKLDKFKTKLTKCKSEIQSKQSSLELWASAFKQKNAELTKIKTSLQTISSKLEEANIESFDKKPLPKEKIFQYASSIKLPDKRQIVKVLENILVNLRSLSTDFDFTDIFSFDKSTISDGKIELKKLQTELVSLQKDLQIKSNTYEMQQSRIELKPDSCSDFTCPLLTGSNDGSAVVTKKSLQALNQRVTKIQDEISAMQAEISFIAEIVEITNDIEYLETEYSFEGIRSAILKLAKKSKDFHTDLIKFFHDVNLELDSYYDYLQNVESVTKQNQLIDTFSEYNNMEKMYLENKKTLDAEILELSESISAVKTEIAEKTDEEEVLVEFIEVLETYAAYAADMQLLKARKDEILQDVQEHEVKFSELKEIKSALQPLETEVTVNEASLATCESNLTDVEVKIKLSEDYFERKDKLEKVFSKCQLISDALSPTKGIPVVKMQNFIIEIRDYANLMLAKTFDGAFQLDFVITEDEFRIPFIKSDGTIGNDIQLASQGEKAIATLAVSFAILLFAIKQSGMRYNIVYCDEIDAELDADNRMLFKYILDQQLLDLGVDQCFIISHNETFNDSENSSVIFTKNDFTSKFKLNVLFKAFKK